jgi:hypothetical protein
MLKDFFKQKSTVPWLSHVTFHTQQNTMKNPEYNKVTKYWSRTIPLWTSEKSVTVILVLSSFSDTGTKMYVIEGFSSRKRLICGGFTL